MATALVSTEKIVCHCLQIMESQVHDAAVIGGLLTLKDVMNCTRAGSGCTACHQRIRDLIGEESDQPSAAGSPI